MLDTHAMIDAGLTAILTVLPAGHKLFPAVQANLWMPAGAIVARHAAVDGMGKS
ncbi:hypothetical protein [Paracoccus haematequi]|uniref:hypothetical protein n=1 Tax=Paracoccus haematequi TaxID=2491866 RepID=UPI0013DFF65F|nr:hypothetical protein [Paracoccus haematequi]